MKKIFSAALFDLDGVVLDTEGQYSEFWGQIGSEYRPDVPDFAQRIKGQTLTQIFDGWITDATDQTAIVRRLDEFEGDMRYIYIKGTRAYVENLRRQGIRTAIVTSSNRAKMESVFRKRPELPGLFDHIFTAEDFAESKPSPDCYLRAAASLGVPIEDCVVYEDSVNGLRSGRASGAYVVGLATTNPRDVIAPLCDVVVEDLSELSEDSELSKIVVDDKIPFIRGRMEQLAKEVVYLPGAAITADDVRDADALIVRTRTHCNRELLEGSRVRFVATATIGYDHLDTQYLDEAGITWTNCPGCNATSVAQYVRNSLLQAEKAGLICLREATVGIVGYGHVGRAVCEALMPLVARVLLNDPPLEKLAGGAGIPGIPGLPSPGITGIPRIPKTGISGLSGLPGIPNTLSDLAALQATCDILTFHTPLTTDGDYPTFHLVDDDFLHALKQKPIIINAARGGVVDEAALLRAMDEGIVRQAIVDTWENEPDVDRELLRRVFIGTPHIAGYSADGKANATRMSLEALEQFVYGERRRDFRLTVPDALPSRTGLQYNPTEDSEALKQDPEAFERLRGNYPLRREK